MKKYRIAATGPLENDGSDPLPLPRHPRFELVRNDDADLDAIVIASPPASHVEDVRAALARGLHVVVVPPFAVDVAGAQRMSEAANAAGLVCGVAYKYRFMPQARATKELIENAHLGAMRSIEIACLNGERRLAVRQERGWWFDRTLGGGVTAELERSIDLAIWFAGRAPKGASGTVRIANPDRVDARGAFTATACDGAFAVLEFGEGLTARLSTDATAPVDSYVCSIYGEDRVAVTSGPRIDETTLYTVDDDETNELQCKPSPFEKAIGLDAALSMELYLEFVKQIEEGSSALPSFSEALEVRQVVAAIGG